MTEKEPDRTERTGSGKLAARRRHLSARETAHTGGTRRAHKAGPGGRIGGE